MNRHRATYLEFMLSHASAFWTMINWFYTPCFFKTFVSLTKSYKMSLFTSLHSNFDVFHIVSIPPTGSNEITAYGRTKPERNWLKSCMWTFWVTEHTRKIEHHATKEKVFFSNTLTHTYVYTLASILAFLLSLCAPEMIGWLYLVYNIPSQLLS